MYSIMAGVRLEDIYLKSNLNDSDEGVERGLEAKDSNIVSSESVFDIPVPSYLMNFPFTVSNEVKNNVFMEQSRGGINKRLIYGQFMSLYSFMSSSGVVYLLPSTYNFQDLPYVANIGMVLPHKGKIFVASNYSSEVRVGEEQIAKKFFEMMRFDVVKCPYKWEGEAELKWLKENIYVGGYGIRTEEKALDWFMESFDMRVIKLKMNDSRYYHLDCVLFVLDKENILLHTNLVSPMVIKELERYVNVISIPSNLVSMDITNNVRFYNYVLCPDPFSLGKNKSDKVKAIETVNFMEKVCVELGLEPVFFNLSEFGKSGASLSCLVLNLNYESYRVPLL